ncbi:hypothetical protein [Haliea atlantica]
MLKNLFALLLLAGSALLLWWLYLAPASAPAPAVSTPPVSREQAWYPQRDWESAPSAALNLSAFAFRDRNRNGVMDGGDLPMAGVAFLLERPAGDLRAQRSNINGYANFSVRLRGDDEDITRAGEPYHFEVMVPPGWQVTTGNARQAATFSALQGSPAGMVTDTPPAVVGLAPDLTISGVVPAGVSGWQLQGPVGDPVALASGAFRVAVQAGHWQLLDGQGRLVREVQVSEAPVYLAALSASPLPAPLPREVQLDFEEPLQRAVIDKLPRGYRGLGFDYLLAVDNQHYQGPGYVNLLMDGRGVGYNSSGYPVTITHEQPGEVFDFEGGWFAVAWPAAEGEELALEGWRQGQRLYHDSLPLSHLGPVWVQADFRRIDELRLSTRHYWQFVTDDLQFRRTRPP